MGYTLVEVDLTLGTTWIKVHAQKKISTTNKILTIFQTQNDFERYQQKIG